MSHCGVVVVALGLETAHSVHAAVCFASCAIIFMDEALVPQGRDLLTLLTKNCMRFNCPIRVDVENTSAKLVLTESRESVRYRRPVFCEVARALRFQNSPQNWRAQVMSLSSLLATLSSWPATTLTAIWWKACDVGKEFQTVAEPCPFPRVLRFM